MLNNLKSYCDEFFLNVFEITPITFFVSLADRNWESDLQSFLEYFLKYQPVKMYTGKKSIVIKKKFKTIISDRNY